VRTRSPISLDISDPKWYKVLKKRRNLSNCFDGTCVGEFARVFVDVWSEDDKGGDCIQFVDVFINDDDS
jgi:hypothetical protein